MSYADLRDFTPEYTSQRLSGAVTVELEKLGGGTPGHAYEGTWRYRVTWPNGETVAEGQDFETGMPKTHREVASELVDMLLMSDRII